MAIPSGLAVIDVCTQFVSSVAVGFADSVLSHEIRYLLSCWSSASGNAATAAMMVMTLIMFSMFLYSCGSVADQICAGICCDGPPVPMAWDWLDTDWLMKPASLASVSLVASPASM